MSFFSRMENQIVLRQKVLKSSNDFYSQLSELSKLSAKDQQVKKNTERYENNFERRTFLLTLSFESWRGILVHQMTMHVK